MYKYLIILIFLISCSNHEKKFSYCVVESKQIKVKTDSNKYFISRTLQITEDTILMGNHLDNSIYLFNKKQQIGKIQFQATGVNGVGYKNGSRFKWINKDTIFLIQFYGKRLIHVNSKGKVISKSKLDENIVIGNNRVSSMSPLTLLSKNKYIFTTYAPMPIIEKQSTYVDRPIYYTLDINNLTLDESKITFRESERSINYYNPDAINLVYDKYKNGIVASFCHDNTVMKIENDSIIQKATFYSDNFSFNKKNEANWDLTEKYSKENSFVNLVKFDEYRNLFYIIVRDPFDDEKLKKSRLKFYDKNNHLIVLNEDLKTICEKKLPASKFIAEVFIDKEGLWISNNNPNNPEFDENYIKYTLLEVKKL